MAFATSQQISKYYDSYKSIDVTFNKQVIHATGLNPTQVYLRVLGFHIPCVIFSTSMQGAKVVATLQKETQQEIRSANNLMSLRFSFMIAERIKPISFFATAKMIGLQPYLHKKPDLNFLTLSYTKRPPDDLIGILGELLDANINAKRRKEERIIVDERNIRKLEIKTKEIKIHINGTPRMGLLRDISFSGVMLILARAVEITPMSPLVVEIPFENLVKPMSMAGKITRTEDLESHEDFMAIGVQFDDTKIPMAYKSRINNYFK